MSLMIFMQTSLAKSIPVSDSKPSDYLKGNYSNSFYIAPVDESELCNVMCNLRKSSSGIDDLKPEIIKGVREIIAHPLVHIINLSYKEGIFPSELKAAYITPLFKGGDPKLVSNYRPVSVLPVFSKIFERLMYNRLISYLEKYKILYNYQFGFKKNHSTDMALTLLLEKILNALENNEHVVGIYLDFAKAFDTVNHSILLSKLSHYGIRGSAHSWLKNYLSDRTQVVKFNDTISDKKIVLCGVPQGSILGPLLFLIYINDLSTVTELFTIMFADDTNLFIQGSDINEIENTANIEIKKIVTWLQVNKLSLNVKKTHSMIFTRNRILHNRINKIVIEGTIIDTVEKTKFLGVIIDNNLCWKDHIFYLCNKIAKGIGIIKKVKDILNRDTLISLYYTFIYPYLIYCNIVWGRAANIYISRLYLLQKRILRIACNTHFLASSEPLFNKCKILTIYKINIYCAGVFMFKYFKGLLPDIFSNMFAKQRDIHLYNTRNNDFYALPVSKTEKRKHSISYYGAYIWNNYILGTTIDVESINTIFTFKKTFRKHLYDLQL